MTASPTATAIARQVAAAETRDRTALLEACRQHADVRLASLSANKAYVNSTLDERVIAAAVLAGSGSRLAKALRDRLVETDADGNPYHVGPMSDDAWPKRLMPALAHIRFLSGDFRQMPAGVGRQYLGAAGKAEVRRYDKLFRAMMLGDAKGAAGAARAFAKADPAKFSLMAYAVWQLARQLGATVPRAYDF